MDGRQPVNVRGADRPMNWGTRELGMFSKKTLVIAASAAAVAGMLIRVGALADTIGGPGGEVGCDPAGAPVAHHANQMVITHPRGEIPTVCGYLTGWPAAENRVEVTNDNTIMYEPALQPGPGGVLGGQVPGNGREESIAISSDEGGKWNATSVQVWPDNYVLEEPQDNNLFVDHATNRFFWYMYSPGPTGFPAYTCGGVGGTVAWSDNDGTTWAWGVDHDHACAENPTVLTGLEKVPGEQISYGTLTQRRIVYLCGPNTYPGAADIGTPGFSCSKSLNGGVTWLGTTLGGQGFFSGTAKDATDAYPQCGGQSSSASNDIQPFPDGTLAVVVSCDSNNFLSESTDEGATWKIVHHIPNAGVLRIDSHGNLYLLDAVNTTSSFSPGSGSGNSELLLSHSTDSGATWSKPLNMVAPGVTSVGTFNFAQGTFDDGLVGYVAVTYYGINPNSPDGKNGYSDGFITATRDALDSNPTFWSGQVNPYGHPLLYNTTTDGNIGVTVLDFNGGAWAPNGDSVWGSWVQDCGSNIATSPGCTSRYPAISPNHPDNGYAGRLFWSS